MKSKKLALASTAVFFIILIISAWRPLSETQSAYDEMPELIRITLPMMEVSKAHTLEVLDAMPEERFNYKPTEISKTFAEQMVHIAYSIHLSSESMMKGNPVTPNEPDPSQMSKAEIRRMLSDSFDEMIESMKGLSAEDLAEVLPRGITRGQGVIFAHDHVTNHRAKANLYLRMNDIEPPKYKFL